MTQEAPLAPFPTAMTGAVAEVLAQTDYPGLTGRELEPLLAAVNLSAFEPGSNKRAARRDPQQRPGAAQAR